MKNTSSLKICNLIAFVGVLIVNALANVLPINDKTTGELSDAYPNLFVPIGLTFSIWALIYLLLGIFIFMQVKTFFTKENGPTYVDKIGWLFVINGIANMLWIVAWHYQYVILSFVIMLVILGSLMAIYTRLNMSNSVLSSSEKWTAKLPFSVYLGWISIATIANATTVLVDNNWSGFGISEEIWTVIMIGIGTLLGLFFLLKKRDWAYAAVIVWAFFGIYLKRSAAEPVYTSITTTTLICMALLVVTGIVALLRKK